MTMNEEAKIILENIPAGDPRIPKELAAPGSLERLTPMNQAQQALIDLKAWIDAGDIPAQYKGTLQEMSRRITASDGHVAIQFWGFELVLHNNGYFITDTAD